MKVASLTNEASNFQNQSSSRLSRPRRTFQTQQSQTDRSSDKAKNTQKDSTVFSRLYKDSSSRKIKKDNINAIKMFQQQKGKSFDSSKAKKLVEHTIRGDSDTYERIQRLKQLREKQEIQAVKEDNQKNADENNQISPQNNVKEKPFLFNERQNPFIQTQESSQDLKFAEDQKSPYELSQESGNLQNINNENLQTENSEQSLESQIKIKQSQYYYKMQQLHSPGSLVAQSLQDVPLCYVNLKNNVNIPPFYQKQAIDQNQNTVKKLAKKIGKVSEAGLKKVIEDRQIQKPNLIQDLLFEQQLQIQPQSMTQNASLNEKWLQKSKSKFSSESIRSTVSQFSTPKNPSSYIGLHYQKNSQSQKNLQNVQTPTSLTSGSSFKSHFSSKIIDQRIQLFNDLNLKSAQPPIQQLKQLQNQYLTQSQFQNSRNSFSSNPYENKDLKNSKKNKLKLKDQNKDQVKPILTLHYSQLSPQIHNFSFKDGCNIKNLLARSQPLEKYQAEKISKEDPQS